MWHKKRPYQDESDLIKVLNKLHEDGILPEHIKVTSSSFGGSVFYFCKDQDEKIKVLKRHPKIKVLISFGETWKVKLASAYQAKIWIHNNVVRKKHFEEFTYNEGDRISEEKMFDLFIEEPEDKNPPKDMPI